jgi:hypothetical protein
MRFGLGLGGELESHGLERYVRCVLSGAEELRLRRWLAGLWPVDRVLRGSGDGSRFDSDAESTPAARLLVTLESVTVTAKWLQLSRFDRPSTNVLRVNIL